MSELTENSCLKNLNSANNSNDLRWNPDSKNSDQITITGFGGNKSVALITTAGVGSSLTTCNDQGVECGVGKHQFRATEEWRCPLIDTISETMRGVAKCYEESGSKDQAYTQLMALRFGQDFSKCLSKKELVQLDSEIERIEKLNAQTVR